jgi:hypothetical protein
VAVIMVMGVSPSTSPASPIGGFYNWDDRSILSVWKAQRFWDRVFKLFVIAMFVLIILLFLGKVTGSL